MQQDSLQEYTTLADSGVLEQLQRYQTKSHDYEELISQALEMFSQTSEDDLVAYLVSCLVQRFIPSYLVVYLSSERAPRQDGVTSMCYQNLRPARCPVAPASLEPYRRLFDEHPQACDKAYLQEQAPGLADELAALNPEILIPLHGIAGLYGFVVLGRKVLDDDYTPDERTYIELLFEFTSIGLQNVIHYTSSVTDYKTRLYNHAFFLRRLQEEINKVGRHHASFAVLALDIDHFKQLNDRYGHLAGDKALYQLSRMIEESVRGEDIVSRYGGEEFLVLLTECSKAAAYTVAERMRQKIAAAEIAYQQHTLAITVSIGIAHCSYPPAAERRSIISRADEALYRAKNSGRNRCELYSPGLLVMADQLREPGISTST